MSRNLAVIYKPERDAGNPLVWFPLDKHASPDLIARQALQGSFADFHQHLATGDVTAQGTGQSVNLYLFLADELVSFHQVDVPEGVRRNLNKLLPVLMEEQLAQDIDQVAVHYVEPSAHKEPSAHEKPLADHEPLAHERPLADQKPLADQEQASGVSNAAAWDRESLASLVRQLKEPSSGERKGDIRLKACLPISACPSLDELITEQPRPDFWRLIPRVPVADQLQLQVSDAPEQFAMQLEGHRWNLMTPEQSEISPLNGVFAVGLLAAGLYLLNQWLSVF
ncbi:MAG: type II secretion system protein GspL [Oceanospirillum sp.]|nr:type II secretion system protein GspL [Oceanospirillum sp.]